jgi:thermitase
MLTFALLAMLLVSCLVIAQFGKTINAQSPVSDPGGARSHQGLQETETSPSISSDANSEQIIEMEEQGYPIFERVFTEIIIGLKDIGSQSYSKLNDALYNHRGEIVNTIKNGDHVVALVVRAPVEEVKYLISDATSTGQSAYAEPNAIAQLDSVPNDVNWTLQWGPQKIRADYAWNTTGGNHTSVLVAVIDSGIDYTHPDLAANYAPLGYDFVNDDADPLDDNGHGTHCAGIIAAEVNNSLGIAGLAQVSIMAEKAIASDESAYIDDLANCLYHAVDQGANILSNSWSFTTNYDSIYNAIVNAVNHNVLVFATSGNTGLHQHRYPAGYDEVVCVSASDSSDNIASFSTWGSWVDVAAPGVHILSTMPTYHVTMNDEGYAMDYDYASGTSMACPHAAGVAALIWSQFPDLTADGVRNQLIGTVDDRGAAGFDPYFGNGRINAQKAVEQSPIAPISISVGVNPTSIRIGDGANISGSVTSSDLGDKSGTVYLEYLNAMNWVSIGTALSNSAGNYLYGWVPSSTGTLTVRSYWIGNENYQAAAETLAILTVNSVDVYEPDDSFAQARLITVSTDPSFEAHDIEPVGDKDYFSFHVDGNSLGAYSFFTLGFTDTRGTLYNSSYTQLAYNDDGNGYPNFRIEYNITVGGNYYLMVHGFSTTHGGYLINYNYTPAETQATANLVVRGSNDQIYYCTYDAATTTWNSWAGLPGTTGDPPAAAVINSELHVVVRGSNNGQIWHSYVDLTDNSFSGWELLSGSTPSAPTLTGNGTHLCLVVRGSNSIIYYRFYAFAARSWTDWTAVPGGTTPDTPAASLTSSSLQIVVRGSGSEQLWHGVVSFPAGTFSGWTLLDGTTPSVPTLTCNGTSLCLVVRGSNSQIYYRWYSLAAQSWSAWSNLPAGTTPDTPAATIIGNIMQIVVRGSSYDQLWYGSMQLSSNSWSGWTMLDGSTPSKPVLTS